MRQTENIISYGKNDIPWVDRRTGGPDHSPTWDDNSHTGTKKSSSTQYQREPGLFFMLQSAAIGLYGAVYIMDGLSWWVLPLWFVLFVVTITLSFLPYIRQVIFIGMSLLYGYWTYHTLTAFTLGPLWAWGGAITTPIITYFLQLGGAQEVQAAN